eukprot:1160913-Pelagomonas_calceolata.AAC.1
MSLEQYCTRKSEEEKMRGRTRPAAAAKALSYVLASHQLFSCGAQSAPTVAVFLTRGASTCALCPTLVPTFQGVQFAPTAASWQQLAVQSTSALFSTTVLTLQDVQLVPIVAIAKGPSTDALCFSPVLALQGVQFVPTAAARQQLGSEKPALLQRMDDTLARCRVLRDNRNYRLNSLGGWRIQDRKTVTGLRLPGSKSCLAVTLGFMVEMMNGMPVYIRPSDQSFF